MVLIYSRGDGSAVDAGAARARGAGDGPVGEGGGDAVHVRAELLRLDIARATEWLYYTGL